MEVEVLDPGSRGLFGLGSRQARIRLTIKPQSPPPASPVKPAVTPPAAPARQAPPVPAATVEEPAASRPEEKPARVAESVEEEELDEDEQYVLTLSQEVVSDLLEKMKVRARVSTSYQQPEEDDAEAVVLVNVEGDDLSILIGRRSETLNSLQYISSLIICKRLDRWVPITIDVQGYRARRERQLRQLARRMADQAIHTGRRQVLEPMPANERRLIHLELRDHPQIATESVGDEPNRKVTIFLKKDNQ